MQGRRPACMLQHQHNKLLNGITPKHPCVKPYTEPYCVPTLESSCRGHC